VSTAIHRFGKGEGPVVHQHDLINQTPIDRFTLIHVLAGGLARMFGVPLSVAVVFAAWFEVAENVFQGGFPSIFPNTADNDSIANSVCDVVSSAAAWTVVDRLKR
jgi:hypothetical protein